MLWKRCTQYVSKFGKLSSGHRTGKGSINPLQYSWLENSIDRGARQALVSVQLLRHVRLFVTPWTEAQQASLSFTISPKLLKLMSIESAMPSNHLILCCPLLLLPSVFPVIRAFTHEMALHIRCSKYWNFSFRISTSNDYSGLISLRVDWKFHRTLLCITLWLSW